MLQTWCDLKVRIYTEWIKEVILKIKDELILILLGITRHRNTLWCINRQFCQAIVSLTAVRTAPSWFLRALMTWNTSTWLDPSVLHISMALTREQNLYTNMTYCIATTIIWSQWFLYTLIINNGHILKLYSPNTFTMQWHCNTGMIMYSPYTRLDTNLLHMIMGLFPILLQATPIWSIVSRHRHRPTLSLMLLTMNIHLIILQPLV